MGLLVSRSLHRWAAYWWQRQLTGQRDCAGLHRLRVVVEHADVPPGKRLSCRTGFHRQQTETDRVRANWPTGFGLPP